jgi:glycosyltransferase involved in cell wall biosynthesis
MEIKSNPFISIVTPVYNCEKYLAECIESVIAQTYDNWEYVIVNNCSTDKTLEITESYAQKDNRIRVHNNEEFLNLMQNWNHAMRQISNESKYCKVVHADDWIFPECIKKMVEVAEKYPSIGIVGAYRLDENQVNLDGLPYPDDFFPGKEIGRQSLLGGPYLFGSPTSILIRSDVIRNLKKFYNEDNIHADQEVCFEILQHFDFGFVHQILTFTRRHNETNTTFTNRFKTYRLGHLTVLKKYGPKVFTKEEYEQRLNKMLKNYYRFLARSVFEFQGKEFWEYHLKALNKIGLSIKPLKLLKAVLIQALDLVTTTVIIKQRLQKRKKF